MSSVCPSGHDSASDDYCDVCGLPIPAGSTSPPAPGGLDGVAGDAPGPSEVPPPAPAAPAAPASAECPNCQATNPPNALFCEACGYDFTTGSMPRPITPSASSRPP